MAKVIMKNIKRMREILDEKIKGTKDFSYYLFSEYKVHPYQEALKIAILYGLLGIIWIAFPDELLSRMTNDTNNFRQLNIYKGWAYVALTVVLIFTLVLKKLFLFEGAINKLETDLGNQKAIEKELNKLAYYDTLTGLPNRALLEMKCKNLIDDKCKKRFAFVYMDVDNFKIINDTLGHPAGDQFLKHISNILASNIGSSSFIARMGGDEFAVIFEDVHNKEEVVEKIQEFLQYLRRPWVFNDQEFFVSVSLGIVIYPEQGDTLSLLLRNSDIAMYEVKKSSKDNYCFYSDDLQEINLKQITMINELHKAVENNEFILLYQPIIDLVTGKMSGVEALIRWLHPEKGIISPMEFIPVAEKTGLIHDIGRWVMQTAFMQKKEWEDLGYPHLKMSINVSGNSLVQNGFVNEIRNLLLKTNLRSSEIQLEITETVLIEEMAVSKKVLNEIKNLGIKIALDDFGTGYSSLTYLKNLPIDVVKLDANFVKEIMNNSEDSVIVESMIKLTHDLKLQMVAEGIETAEQLSMLKSDECDFGQGYLFSRPVSWDMIEKMMLATS